MSQAGEKLAAIIQVDGGNEQAAVAAFSLLFSFPRPPSVFVVSAVLDWVSVFAALQCR